MAQIRAKDRGDADQRRAWKLRLIRLMYDRGYDRGTVLELFRVIDWMIRLPAEAEAAFRKDLYDFETSKRMPSITTVELAGIKKGIRRGRQQGGQQGEAALFLWLIEKRFARTSRSTSRPGGDRRQRRPADLVGSHPDGGQHCAGARLSEQVV